MLHSRPTWLSDDLWMEVGSIQAPQFTLPDDKIHVAIKKRYNITADSIVGRAGVQAIKDQDASDAHKFLWSRSSMFSATGIPPSYVYSHLAAGLTKQAVESIAAQKPLVFLEGNDFQEGSYAMPEESEQFLWWMAKRKAMYQEAGKVRRDQGGHGSNISYQGGIGGQWRYPGGSDIEPTHDFYKNMYKSVQAARATCTYFNVLENLCGTNIKFYADLPDYGKRYYLEKHAAEIMGKGMGKVGGLGPGFMTYTPWGKMEGLGDAREIHEGIVVRRRVENPAGWVETIVHPPVSYSFQVGCIFSIGFCMTNGYVPFDNDELYGADPTKMTPLNINPTPERDRYVNWIPDVPGTPAPVVQQGGFYEEPCRWLDAGYEAAYYYSKMNRTAGKPWLYMRYREGDDPWIETQPDGSDILYHAAANNGPNAPFFSSTRRGRGDSMYRFNETNQALDFWYFDPSRPVWDKKVITFNYNNFNMTAPTKGNTLYVWSVTL